MATSGRTNTREKLLDAATELWATQGSLLVSLNLIVEAAGQRNASALQYHFGNREGLIDALFDRHTPKLREQRQSCLDSIDSSDPRAVAEALVIPLGSLLSQGWRERGFLCVSSDLLGNTQQSNYDQVLAMGSADVINQMMLQHLSHVPKQRRGIRLRVAGLMIVHSLADEVRRYGIRNELADPEIFTANLVDMYLGAVLAEPVEQPGTVRAVTKA